MQGASPPGGLACEKSRTESEGQARPLFLSWGEALAPPKRLEPMDEAQSFGKLFYTISLLSCCKALRLALSPVFWGNKLQIPAH